MSLINQMLKDLESRRTPEPAAAGVLPGNRPVASGSGPRPLTLLLVASLLLLSLGLAYLLWQQRPTPADLSPSPVAPVTIPAAPVTVVTPRQTVVAQQPELALPPRAEPVINNVHPVTIAPARVAERTEPDTPHLVDEPPAGSGESRMEKVIHPPSASEQADRLYQQGYRALQQRNHTDAEQLWQQALAAAPAHLPSREGLIALYLSQGRKVEGGKLLAEGTTHHPGHAPFAMLHARLLAEQGDSGAALAALEQALMGNSEPPADLLALAAALYQQRHDYDNSIRAYQRALQRQPQQGHWWMGIAISLEGAGRPGEAKSAYQEARQRGALSGAARQYVEQRLSALR
ncbi:MAG: tetratricopeptide repeat protein [Gammaproteobacteria bacterium]|nr:tetratricopeptide repeat protein [Gammaproteobacteria bacterium]